MAIRLEIEIVMNDAGAVTAIRKVGDEAEKAGDKTKKAGESGKEAFKSWATSALAALASIETINRAMDYLWEGMTGAAQEQRAISGLAAQMKDLGVNVDYGKIRVEQFADAMKKAGFEDEQTRAAIARMLPITRDLEKAILATNVAYGASIKYNKDVSETMELMVSLMVGSGRGLLQAQKQFGVILDENAPKAQQFQSALDQLTRSTKGVADNTRDAQARILSLGIVFDDLKKGLGADVLPYFVALSDVLEKVNLDLKEAVEWSFRLTWAISTFGLSESSRSFLKWFGQDAPKAMDMMASHAKSLAPALQDCHTQLTTMATDAKGAVQDYSAQVDQLFNAIQKNRDAMITLVEITRTPAPISTLPAQTPVASGFPGSADNLSEALALQDQLYSQSLSSRQVYNHQMQMLNHAELAGFRGMTQAKIQLERQYNLNRMAMAAQAVGSIGAGLTAIAGKNRAMFIAGQAAAAAQTIINAYVAWSQCAAQGGIYGFAFGAAIFAAVMGFIAQIKAQKPPEMGQAHDGLDYVPRTGTYLLEQGESVIPRYKNVPGYSGGDVGGSTIHVDARGAWFNDQRAVSAMAKRLEKSKARGYVN